MCQNIFENIESNFLTLDVTSHFVESILLLNEVRSYLDYHLLRWCYFLLLWFLFHNFFLHILTNYVAFLKYWYIYDFGYLFMAIWWSHLKVYVHFNVSFSKFKMQNISQMMMTLKSNDALTHSLNAIKTYFWQTKFDICHFFLFSYLSCAF